MSIKDIAKKHSDDSVSYEDFEEPMADFEGNMIPQKEYDSLMRLHERLGRRASDTYNAGLINVEPDVGVIGYHFYDTNAAEFPTEINDFTSLKWLKVTASGLESIPDSLADLKYLESLSVGYNKIKKGGADVIGKMKGLEYLRMYNLDYDVISDSVSNLEKLKLLEISNSRNVKTDQISKLKNLEDLSINCGPKLKEIDDSIGNLENVQRLSLSNNDLETLPESIGNLKNLKHLNLAVNYLSSLPKSIGNLESLDYLNVRGNKLKSLPVSITDLSKLTDLNVSSNYIKMMPYDIHKLEKLSHFQYHGNPLSKKEVHRIKRTFRRG